MAADVKEIHDDLRQRLARLNISEHEYNTIFRPAGTTIRDLERGANFLLAAPHSAHSDSRNVAPTVNPLPDVPSPNIREMITQVQIRTVTLNTKVVGADGKSYSEKETAMNVNNVTILQTLRNLRKRYFLRGEKEQREAYEKRQEEVINQLFESVCQYEEKNKDEYRRNHIGKNRRAIELELVSSLLHYCALQGAADDEFQPRDTLILWWLAANDTSDEIIDYLIQTTKVIIKSPAERASYREEIKRLQKRSFMQALQDAWRGHNIQDSRVNPEDNGEVADHSCVKGFNCKFAEYFFGRHPDNVFATEPNDNFIVGNIIRNILETMYFAKNPREQQVIYDETGKTKEEEALIIKFYDDVVTAVKSQLKAKYSEALIDPKFTKFQAAVKLNLDSIKLGMWPLPKPVGKVAAESVEASNRYVNKWAQIEEHQSLDGMKRKDERYSTYFKASAEVRVRLDAEIDAKIAVINRSNSYADKAMIFKLYSKREEAYYAIFTPLAEGNLKVVEQREAGLANMEATHEAANRYVGKWALIEEHQSFSGMRQKETRYSTYCNASPDARPKLEAEIDAELALVHRANNYADRAMAVSLYQDRTAAYYSVYTPYKQGQQAQVQAMEQNLIALEAQRRKP